MHRPYISAQESSDRFMKLLSELAGKPQMHYFLEGLFVNLCWHGAVPSMMEFNWELVCWASRSDERGWKRIPNASGLPVVTTEEHYSQAKQK